jgi:hypothetical protein
VSDASPEEVRRVTGEIEGLQQDLGSIVSELDRRRRELMDVRLQIRRHPLVVVAAAGAAALLLGGVVALLLRDRRRRSQPTARIRESRRALARLLEHPDRVAAQPNVAAKIATAAGVAAGSVIARHLARLAVAKVAPAGAAQR